MEEPLVLAPASVPQEDFLMSQSTVTLYAGSAGAGKTFAIILNLIKFMSQKNTNAVVFRRTRPELQDAGGIWHEAWPLFKKIWKNCKIRHNVLEIFIPENNSRLKFKSLQYASDVDKALGGQYSVIFFDEAVTFDLETFILPLLGRLRTVGVDYTPQMFWATNPRFAHGIYHWIKDFYLDEYGIPLKEKSNQERWFVLINNKPKWFDDYQEAIDYCKTIPTPVGQEIKPRSFRAIRAHVTDNIPLMKNNPDYIANLQSMPEIKRRIFLDGSWTAREEEAGYFKREFCPVVPIPNVLAIKRVRAWDLSSTQPSSATPDPDWTRGTLVSKDKDGMYTVEDIVSLRDRPLKVEQLIYRTAAKDPEGTVYVIPVDPGQAGISYSQIIRKNLAQMGIICKLVKTNKSKLTRFLPVSAVAQAGYLSFVAADWNEEAFEELERFNGAKNNGHDDIADTLSDAVLVLNQSYSAAKVYYTDDSVSSSPPASNPYSFNQTSAVSGFSFNNSAPLTYNINGT